MRQLVKNDALFADRKQPFLLLAAIFAACTKTSGYKQKRPSLIKTDNEKGPPMVLLYHKRAFFCPHKSG